MAEQAPVLWTGITFTTVGSVLWLFPVIDALVKGVLGWCQPTDDITKEPKKWTKQAYLTVLSLHYLVVSLVLTVLGCMFAGMTKTNYPNSGMTFVILLIWGLVGGVALLFLLFWLFANKIRGMCGRSTAEVVAAPGNGNNNGISVLPPMLPVVLPASTGPKPKLVPSTFQKTMSIVYDSELYQRNQKLMKVTLPMLLLLLVIVTYFQLNRPTSDDITDLYIGTNANQTAIIVDLHNYKVGFLLTSAAFLFLGVLILTTTVNSLSSDMSYHFCIILGYMFLILAGIQDLLLQNYGWNYDGKEHVTDHTNIAYVNGFVLFGTGLFTFIAFVTGELTFAPGIAHLMKEEEEGKAKRRE
jgi:hypothetical protein